MCIRDLAILKISLCFDPFYVTFNSYKISKYASCSVLNMNDINVFDIITTALSGKFILGNMNYNKRNMPQFKKYIFWFCSYERL